MHYRSSNDYCLYRFVLGNFTPNDGFSLLYMKPRELNAPASHINI